MDQQEQSAAKKMAIDRLIEQFRFLNRQANANALALADMYAKLRALSDSDQFAEIQRRLQALSDHETPTVTTPGEDPVANSGPSGSESV